MYDQIGFGIECSRGVSVILLNRLDNSLDSFIFEGGIYEFHKESSKFVS